MSTSLLYEIKEESSCRPRGLILQVCKRTQDSCSFQEASFLLQGALAINQHYHAVSVNLETSAISVDDDRGLDHIAGISSFCLPLKMSFPVIRALANPCLPGLAVEKSVTFQGNCGSTGFIKFTDSAVEDGGSGL